MTNRRLIETITVRATAGEPMPIGSLAAQPRVHRFLFRSSLGVGLAAVLCAGLVGLGSGSTTAATPAGDPSGPAEAAAPEAAVAGLAAGATAEVATLDTTPIEGAELQGIVAPTAAPVPTTLAAPPATVAPAPPPPPAAGSVEAVISEVFGPHAAGAIGVARCESRLNPGAVSRGGGNWGLFQINTVHRARVARMGFAWEQLLDARVNSLVAKSIFDEQGWGPWACRHAAR